MAFRYVQFERPDPLAETPVPETVKHARTVRLIAQVAGLALSSHGVETAERLGLRLPDSRTTAPDFYVLPGGAIDWETTSYSAGPNRPAPLVRVEIVVDSSPDIADLVSQGIITYLIYVDRALVLRFDPQSQSTQPVPDDQPCRELGGIAFRRGIGRVGVVDHQGRVWYDPDDHLRILAAEHDAAQAALDAAEAAVDALRAERDAVQAERDAVQAERDVMAARIVELERRLEGPAGG